MNYFCVYFFLFSKDVHIRKILHSWKKEKRKSDHEIFVYLYILRQPEFIYAIFMIMNLCLSVCMSKHYHVYSYSGI